MWEPAIMSITITGVVKNGVVVPSNALPEGAEVEIRLSPLAEQARPEPIHRPRLPDLIPVEEISAPCDLPRSSRPVFVSTSHGPPRLPDLTLEEPAE